jgi:hypothetical protein
MDKRDLEAAVADALLFLIGQSPSGELSEDQVYDALEDAFGARMSGDDLTSLSRSVVKLIQEIRPRRLPNEGYADRRTT